jgi:hypothetical protein
VTQTEALLNLFWVLLCLTGLGVHFWRSRNHNAQTAAARVRRTLSVLVAAVALFPCISASDDRVRLGSADTLPASELAFAHSHLNSALIPILEDPEHGQTPAPLQLAFFVSFFVMVRVETPSLVRWFPLTSLGRAPPAMVRRMA